MAKKTIKQIDFSKVAANIIKSPLENFVEDSYLPYAHYVIMSRALISDDGLKPVQRRILYAMNQLGLTDKKDFIKAAQVVGETMGNYHPHGDSSIGEALARLGQTFSMRVPLVDVQGSVGFTTGDDPAAPRYWEARPTTAAMELTNDLSQGAVKMGKNYDGKIDEPTMLPIKWPNGLINGSQGIAVGYSSTILPHNPTEVMDSVIALLKNPDLSIEEIMKIMPGPDMPTGGILVGYEGVKEYYETGRGTISIRGRYTIEPGARGTNTIVFSEAPYQVSAEQIVTAVDKNKKDRGRFKEIASVKDLSDIDNGFKLNIKIKAGANPQVVLKDIFKYTPLEQIFSVNMNVLQAGVPKVSTIKEMLQGFIDFRSECIVNKVNYRLVDLDRNIERLAGIIAVLVDIDKAISIIRKSEDSKIANEKLQKHFKINEEQSSYILSMPLRRLTKSDSLSIKNEIKELKEEHVYLNSLLSSEKLFSEYMIKELEATKKIIDSERRTTINNKTEEELKIELANIKKAATQAAKNSECYITLFADDTITRTAEPYKQERSPIAITSQLKTKTKDNFVLVSRNGQALRLKSSFIPENVIIDVSLATGLQVNTVVGIAHDEFKEENLGILLITSLGGINIVNGKLPTSDEFPIVKLENGETVIKAYSIDNETFENRSILLVSSGGNIIHFPIEQIRTSNPGAGTIKGMNIEKDETVVGASIINPEAQIQVVSCSYQTMKVTDISEIPPRNRNAKGVLLQRLGKEDEILVAEAGERVIANKNGRNITLPKTTARALSGEKRTGSDILLGQHSFQ